MDRDEFGYAVRSLSPELLPEAHDLAIGHYLAYWPKLDKQAVKTCIILAGVWHQSLSNGTPASTSTQVAGPSAPSAAIGSHQLALKILPAVVEIRQKFFGRADPPFSSWAEAEGWLRGTKDKEAFEGACQALAEATGFPRNEVERYVLAALEPFLSHCEVTIQNLPYRTRAQISLEWAFGDTDVRKATQEARKGLGVSRLKGLNKRDQRLLELIQQFGDPPSISNTAHWEQWRLLLNADPTIKPYPTAKAVEMHYRRLPEKLRRLSPAPPATPTK